MSDNVAITAGTGTTVAADEVVDGVLGTVKAQFVKVMDGTLDSTNKLIVSSAGAANVLSVDAEVTGTISATDALGGLPAGDGTFISTAPTANSFVAIACPGGNSSVAILITGTATGVYYFEGSLDSTTGSDGNWVTVVCRILGPLASTLSFNAATTGIFVGNLSGFQYFRVRNRSGTTPSNSITLRLSSGTGPIQISNPLPPGSAIIGSIRINDGVTATGLNSAANQSAATANGTLLAEKGPRWQVVSTPAVSTKASASKAAGGAGVRHVCDSISFSAGATTAPVLTKLNINLRDGATGAGTIIWSCTVVIPAATGQSVLPQHFGDLNLVGTANTAMTLEFSALLTSLFEDVSISGYDVT